MDDPLLSFVIFYIYILLLHWKFSAENFLVFGLLSRIQINLFENKQKRNFQLSCLTTNFMDCLPLADLHHFCLTKRFPNTPSAIQPIGMPSVFCMDQILPGFVLYILILLTRSSFQKFLLKVLMYISLKNVLNTCPPFLNHKKYHLYNTTPLLLLLRKQGGR